MRFRALPVTSLEDATLNFEQLQGHDILDQTGESVLQLAVTGTKRKVAFGVATLAFTVGVQQSGQLTIAHGLGTLPVFFSGQPDIQAASNATIVAQTWKAADATNIYFYATDSVAPGGNFNIGLYWLAIG